MQKLEAAKAAAAAAAVATLFHAAPIMGDNQFGSNISLSATY